MFVSVYSRPSCVQCNATYRALDKAGVPYKKAEYDASPEIQALAAERGFASAPVVTLTSVSGMVVDAWSGFRPDKIKNLALVAV